MSTTSPTRPPPTKPRPYSSLPLTTFPAPGTPRRSRVPATALGLTPLSRASSVLKNQEGNTDRVDKYDREDYENYIREDLGSRVFVDFEVFMKRVLHAPDDWEARWKPAIDAVKADKKFKKHHKEYCRLCEESGTLEKDFYPALVETANVILDVASRSKCKGIPSKERQYYHINHPNHLKGGIMNKKNLSPDLVLLQKDRRRPESKESLHWANPLHVLEVKPYDTALCDGRKLPRLVVDGIDPIQNHAAPPTKLRYRAKKRAPLTTTTHSTTLVTSQSIKKRSADSSPAADPRAPKRPKTNSVSQQTLEGSASVRLEKEDNDRSPPKPEFKHQTDSAIQVCRYLLEMFSVPLLRSHATVGLVDRDRLQLYHGNRSVILISSAINLSDGDGKDKFIATVIAFHCLSLEQNGVLEARIPTNARLVSKIRIGREARMVQTGKKLHFLGNAKHGPFEVILGDTISRDPAMIGRSTLVLNATSEKWPDIPLVLKISWPTSGRVPETDFLKKASDMAEGDHAWAANHLPRVYYAEDVAFRSDSTLESVAGLFEDAKFANGNYVYERRTLRIIIQERLYPLKSLTSVKDIGQVFLDVACVHNWLYKHPGILHRDLSFNNIMCRFIKAKGDSEQRVYGVLTDYDLSSWTKALKDGYTKTSQQRTGTPPFMAHELLKGTSPLHLYRHDVESLFYVMLLTAARHTIGALDVEEEPRLLMRESTELPYQDWFNEPRYNVLGLLKGAFFLDMQAIKLSPAFKDFRPWLEDLQGCFSVGFKDKPLPSAPVQRAWKNPRPDAPEFDDETLGDNITYDLAIAPAPHLTGELKGLVIRDPKVPPVPVESTTAGVALVDD